MTVNLEESDYKALRTFVRFAAMGVMPSRERADAAIEVVKAAGSDGLVRVCEVAEGIRKGVLASQGACQDACGELERVWGQAETRNERPAPGANGRG